MYFPIRANTDENWDNTGVIKNSWFNAKLEDYTQVYPGTSIGAINFSLHRSELEASL